MAEAPTTAPALRRELGLPGAVLMGLGSIVGTGIFVSVGLAAGVAGPAVLVAIGLAAAVAACNGLSSAQLAANHPVSGGTYEYGYRLLRPWIGFAAGWTFLCAKTASAATAALGVGGYALHAAGVVGAGARIALGVAVALVVTALVAGGIRRSSRANTVIVVATLLALGLLVAVGTPRALAHGIVDGEFARGDGAWDATRNLLEATALMFVAYTGYGRIATLGEEVRDPRRTIPRAMVVTLVVSALLYLAVAAAAIGLLGADGLAAATRAGAAPLEAAARRSAWPALAAIVTVGALAAMLGVLLNLVLGLSRVLLAMGRRGDMPAATARVDAGGSPRVAVIAVGVAVAALAACGSVATTWSFSAFTVLVYYAITNLAALRLPREQRLVHPVVPWCGLVGCCSLAFWVEPRAWIAGLAVIAVGLVGRALARRRARITAPGS